MAVLGDRYQLNGGEIKNAVFKAAFRAARAGALTQALLEEAAFEEVEAAGRKSGRMGFAA